MHFLREGMRWWIACYIWIMGDLVSRDPGMNDRGRKSLKINTLGIAHLISRHLVIVGMLKFVQIKESAEFL